jgi:hypothetical protein
MTCCTDKLEATPHSLNACSSATKAFRWRFARIEPKRLTYNQMLTNSGPSENVIAHLKL